MSTNEPTNPTEYTDAEIDHAFAGMIGPLAATMTERAVRRAVTQPPQGGGTSTTQDSRGALNRAVREIQSLRAQVQELTQDRNQLRLALEEKAEAELGEQQQRRTGQ